MPPVLWALHNNRPTLQVELVQPDGGPAMMRRLLADTGAGNRTSAWELILNEGDCLLCGSALMGHVRLSGAYSGYFPVYAVNVRIPQLSFDEPIAVVGVSRVPARFEGIAGFRFLDRFHCGNFGDRDSFGLEPLQGP